MSKKAILVIDIPENIKNAYAHCTIYEQKRPYRMFNRIAKVKPMPRTFIKYKDGYYMYADEILGEENA